MTIYLAGSSAEPLLVDNLSYSLAMHGHSTLHAWTNPRNLENKTPRQIWMQCLAQINRSDAMVVVQPSDPKNQLRGAIFEAGYAIAKGKPVFLLFPSTERNGDWWQSPGIVGVYSNLQSLIEALEPLK